MTDLLLDLRRAVLLVWVSIVYGSVPLVRYLFHAEDSALTYPVRVRMALERLGTTFLKLGQFMAMRFDLLPVELCDELTKLFDTVSPLSLDAVLRVIESELKRPAHQVFIEFETEPLAAATIAQVHRAVTHSGERVAVKVQRPGIQRVFESDMRNLRRLAIIVDWTNWWQGISAQDAVTEFAVYTRREMDFRLEGYTADRLRRHATRHEKVPLVYWEWSTVRVLTMEYVTGVTIAQAIAAGGTDRVLFLRQKLRGFEPKTSLHHFAFASLHQLFGTGFFHADPHPGNVMILDDNRIAFLDFGIFGNLSRHKRELLTGYIESLSRGDIDQSYVYYAKLATLSATTDPAAFKADTKQVLSRWYEASLRGDASVRERHVGTVVGDIMNVLRRHRVHVDMDTLLFWRATIALDSSALSISPDFDLVGEMRYFFESTQPSVVQRAVNMAIEPEPWLAAYDVVLRALNSSRWTSTDLTPRLASRIVLEESGPFRAAANRDMRWIALSLWSVVVVILAVRVPLLSGLLALAAGAFIFHTGLRRRSS